MCSIATSVANVVQFRDSVSPETKRRLITCPNGCDLSNVSAELVVDSKHFTCFCSECNHKWYVCLNCSRQNSHYTRLRQLKRHQSFCKTSFNDSSTSLNHFHLHPTLGGNVLFSFFEFMELPHFGRNENRKFYFHNQINQGLSYIVGWSQFHLPNVSTFLRKDEVHSQVRIADILLGLFPKKIYQFTKLMEFFKSELDHLSYNDKWRCQLPTNLNMIRKFYKEGKYAIHPNLPHPSVEIIDGHSYVPLKEIIQDALANDTKYDPIFSSPTSDRVSMLNESAFCQNLFEHFHPRENTIDILLTRWSDDFEPYNIKQNKGNSIWLFSVSIYCKTQKTESHENTYVVSMGLKTMIMTLSRNDFSTI